MRHAARTATWCAASVMLCFGAIDTRAQEAGEGPGLQLLLTPYVWAPRINADIKTPIPQAPTVSQDISFSQLFTHLSWIPFMGSAEVRGGSFGAVVDYVHTPVRSGVNTHNVLFSGGTGDLVVDVATVDFLYRPIAQPSQYLDVGVGVRPWGVATNISLNSGLLPGVSAQPGGSWADPLIALRYHHELGSGFGLTAYGDVGGFGLAAHTDWQVIGTVDYAPRSWIDFHFGYRSLNVNYSTGRNVGFNVNMDGPIIGGTFRF
jgi:hypothetical protein